jgi:hypothetical protein
MHFLRHLLVVYEEMEVLQLLPRQIGQIRTMLEIQDLFQEVPVQEEIGGNLNLAADVVELAVLRNLGVARLAARNFQV